MSRSGRTRGRVVDGVLLLDKPEGWSSNQALQWAKRLYGARKAGHTGSLDPIATGMLPLCFGEATKFSSQLLNADKRYQVEARLGQRTDTLDREGEILETLPVVDVSAERVTALLASRFSGEIEQVPPMYSALKRQGVPLYKLAREGKEVERAARRVVIHSAQVLELQGDRLLLDVHCSKGTYIRSLVDDLGRLLGCGAHVAALRRTGVAGFDVAALHAVDELEGIAAGEDRHAALDALLLPVDAALRDWPSVQLTPICTHNVQQGNPVRVPDLPDAQFVRLQGSDGQPEGGYFLGIGEILDDGRVAPRRLVRVPA